jgi:hypothetical protein
MAFRTLFITGVLALSGCTTVSTDRAAPAIDENDIQVMVLGAFHMGNPGRDVANAEIENMLTEQRQAEIAAIGNALLEFNPTVVAVERITQEPKYIDPKFVGYTPDDLLENADERYQLGYRVAGLAGIARVYGIDEQPTDDEPDYFPFDKLMAQAAEIGESEKINAKIADVQEMMAEFSAMQKDMNVAELLILQNEEGRFSSADFYYETFGYDRGEKQPGAELQAYWFMRNAKIFSKLVQVTQPGDRVLIVYGAGHKYWLDHFATHTPGFVMIDPVPYLEKAAAAE